MKAFIVICFDHKVLFCWKYFTALFYAVVPRRHFSQPGWRRFRAFLSFIFAAFRACSRLFLFCFGCLLARFFLPPPPTISLDALTGAFFSLPSLFFFWLPRARPCFFFGCETRLLNSCFCFLFPACFSARAVQFIAGAVEQRVFDTVLAARPGLSNLGSTAVRSANLYIGSLTIVDWLRFVGLQN